MITRSQFIAATGRSPDDDDLDRCNCPLAGKHGHAHCGWNYERNLPKFMDGWCTNSSPVQLPCDVE